MARRRSDTHGRSGSLHGGSRVAQADAACLCMRPDLDTVLTRHMHTSAAVPLPLVSKTPCCLLICETVSYTHLTLPTKA